MIKTIYARRSVRTFKKTQVKPKDLQKIVNILKSAETQKNPFDNDIKFFMIEDTFTQSNQKMKIGTYGFVKNPQGFVGGKVNHTFDALIDFGYQFEGVILELTKINIGTVWLGGTFKRKQFEHLLEHDEIIPAISPIGYPDEKKSWRERFIRNRAKSDKRKPFEMLFFNQSTQQPLSLSHPLAHLLKLVQSGPSASNKQPWRLSVDESSVHVFFERTNNYASFLSYDIQALDIGIAIKHFELGLTEEKVPYTLIRHTSEPKLKDYQYIISFEFERSYL